MNGPTPERETYAAGPEQTTFDEVVALVADRLSRPVSESDSSGAVLKGNGPLGDVRIQMGDGRVLLEFDIAQLPASTALIDLRKLIRLLASTSPRTMLLPPKRGTATVALEVLGQPLSLLRCGALETEVDRLKELSEQLTTLIPERVPQVDRAAFRPFQEVLEPVELWQPPTRLSSDITSWLAVASARIDCRISLALVAESPIATEAICALLAKRVPLLGRLLLPSIDAAKLTQLASRAPGPIVVSPTALATATNRYDIASEMINLFESLASMGKSIVLVGSQARLSSVLNGGQTGQLDPLKPMLLIPPPLPLDLLGRFAVDREANSQGGMAATHRAAAVDEVVGALQHRDRHQRERLLEPVARWALSPTRTGTKTGLTTFADDLAQSQTTLGGLPPIARHQSEELRRTSLVDRVLSDDFMHHFTDRLFGQDEAIQAFVEQIQSEVLTRSPEQPMCCCLQGTSGTGKSMAVRLLAEYLPDYRLEILDGAFSDTHEARSDLIGAPAGYVGSDQAGRLVKAVQNPARPTVFEIADLDRAERRVRSYVTRLLMQPMEQGTFQSRGVTFSAASTILCFTVNLPDGQDERLRRGVGFGDSRPDSQLVRTVENGLKHLFQAPVMSRLGRPILFKPLDQESRARTLMRSLEESLRIGLSRLGCSNVTLMVAEEVGMQLLSTLDSDSVAFGVRRLQQAGRHIATRALALKKREGQIGQSLKVVADGQEIELLPN